jgi:selenocysteine-specific elongation factor
VGGGVRVIATAGHVDHGKSTLVELLTGVHPDRLGEEQRRGLTIELGYAWCELPEVGEVAFVDVPGHERFLSTMLAGIGPVPLVLFVVAADEGWSAQSEEHLAIVDLLRPSGMVVALTKVDLVDRTAAAARVSEMRERLRGTSVADAQIVPVSGATGEGETDLLTALGSMVAATPSPTSARTRLHIDRVFTVRGAGTVVTGTLTGGCFRVGQAVEVAPSGQRARVRGLQAHRRSVEKACHVGRVAVNLAGIARGDIDRGDVLVEPGRWRPTEIIEVHLYAARSLQRPVMGRGAFRFSAGASGLGATVRLLDPIELAPGGEAFARIRLAAPAVLDLGDRCVLRDVGRREIVAGAAILDTEPPKRPGPAALLRERLGARGEALATDDGSRERLLALLVRERGVIPAREAVSITGARVEQPPVATEVLLSDELLTAITDALVVGQPRSAAAAVPVRGAVERTLAEAGVPVEPDVVERCLDALLAAGTIVRGPDRVLLRPGESAARPLADRDEPAMAQLLAAVGGEREAEPPSVRELETMGISPEVIEAAVVSGDLLRLRPDLVVMPDLVRRAEDLVRSAPDGITVAAFREALGTTRRVALPLLERFDRRGITRREGDLRFPTRPTGG